MTKFRLTSIDDLSFGVHSGRSFDALDHDFLCIAGLNESGKSTLAEFLQWMIAGPGGNTASAARFQREQFSDPIGGHLVGRLDEDPIEILARFILKGNGLPNDTRQVRRRDRPIDTASWTSVLGQITPADYRLLHRLRGADLGGLDESRSFSDVFTRFAIGADSAQVNPRERLAGLLRRSTQLEKDLRLRRTDLKKISAALATASARPAEVERLELEVEEKQRSVEALAQELDNLHREENLLDRTLEIAPARREFDRIRAELGRLDPISEQWRQVARSHDEILRRQADIAERVAGLETLDARAVVAAGVAGVSVSDLRGRELSFTERNALSTGARRVAEIERELRDARADAGTLSGRLGEQETAVLRSAVALGIEPPDGLSLLGQELTLRDLITEAGQWSARESDAAEAEARVSGLRARVDSGSSTAPTVRRISPRVLAALAGVVLAAASSLVSPLLTIAVAVLTVLAVLLLPDRVAGSVGSPSTGAERLELPEASRRAAELRSRADDTRKDLAAALGRLGITDLPPSSVASSHLSRLTDLARDVTVLVSDREASTRMIGTIADLESQLSLARAELAADLAARGVHRVPPSDQFDQWLQSYEEALLAVREHSEAAGTLRRLEVERDEFVEPVIDDLRGLSWPVRLDRIGQMRRLVDEVEGLETSASVWAARLDLAADEAIAASVDELLRTHDEQALVARLEAVRDQIITSGARRDTLNREAEGAAIGVRALIQHETFAALEAEHGDVEAAIAQLDRDKEALRIAAEVLGSVIDQFEAEDQDPLIKRAQMLVERVVPDWGDLIFSRSEKGEAIIERRDGLARLDDSRLSDGARALLYLALRLAFVAADTERRGVALPILCDDPLVHLDDTRRPGAIGLLADASRTNQVLLFTCDDATVALARDNGAHVVHL